MLTEGQLSGVPDHPCTLGGEGCRGSEGSGSHSAVELRPTLVARPLREPQGYQGRKHLTRATAGVRVPSDSDT